MDESDMPAVRFVVYEGIAGNDVVKSQVLGLARELSRVGAHCSVVVFERIDRYVRGRTEARASMSAEPGVRLDLRVVPRLHGRLGLRLAAWTLRAILGDDASVIHCRGAKGVVAALGVRSAHPDVVLVGDFRGAEPEEAVDLLRRGVLVQRGMGALSPGALEQHLTRMEQAAVTAVDHALCVSAALATHFAEKYQLSDDKVSVVHCGASAACDFDEDARVRVRRELGLTDELLLCHLGGLSSVHRPDMIASLALALSTATDRKVALLLLTRDAPVAEALRSELADELRVIIRSTTGERVPEYLSASDAGMLMLDSAFRNRVSFPVKYSEYACCGLPVVMTPFSADPARHLREMGWGVLVQQDASGEWLASWPRDASLVDAVTRVCAATAAERRSAAARAAEAMRFDHTCLQVMRAYDLASRRKRGMTG